jgi:hypothetical protein
MQKCKLLVYLAVWKRPEITEICFLGLNRLRCHPDYDINVLAVISEESMIPLCEKYGVNWVMHENLPLGRKKNFGLQHSLKFQWDYMIEIGSDDLLKNEMLDLYAPYFGKNPIIGMTNFCFINTEDLACRVYNSRSGFGVGRAIHREVVEKIGALWIDGKNHGLDNNSTFMMARRGFLEKRIHSQPLAIDLKSDVNIWQFNYLQGEDYPIEEALKGLSEEEIEGIKKLCHAEA